MTDTNIAIEYELDTDGGQLLISDLAANGNVAAASTPSLFVRAFLMGLIEVTSESDEVETVTVNTSCMSHIDALEEVGFEVVYEEEHFVTAEYCFP